MKLLDQIYYVSNDYSKDDVHTTICAQCEPHALLFFYTVELGLLWDPYDCFPRC